jgi:hypothetical protein
VGELPSPTPTESPSQGQPSVVIIISPNAAR